MRSLSVFYDRECGLCRLAKGWLADQRLYLPVRCVPLNSVAELQPAFAERITGDDLVVAADTGEVWRGDAAFIMCLWATRRYRRLAMRLSRPALRPLARKAFGWVSVNRHNLSQLLGLSDDELHAVIERQAPSVATCSTIPQVLDQLKREGTTA